MTEKKRTASSSHIPKKSTSKRETIIEGALNVFLEDGYNGASMDRIAEVAGVSKQTIYSHFGDKENLFIELSRALAESLQRHGENSELANLEPEQFLHEICRQYFKRMDSWEYRSFFRVVIAESNKFPDLAQLYVESIVEPGLVTLTDYFAAHPQLGLNDPEAQARIFRGALASFVLVQDILSGSKSRPMDRERFTRALVDTIINNGAPGKSLSVK